MENATTESRDVTIATGDIEASFITIKASTFPLKRRTIRSNGPDKNRQQIHGVVETVQNGPRDLTRQHRKNIVNAEGNLQGLTQVNVKT